MEVIIVFAQVSRLRRFRRLLTSSPLDVDALRRLSWSGVPMRVRASVWRVLSLECVGDGNVVTDLPRALETQRRRYWAVAATLFREGVATPGKEAYRQVQIDVPRMASHFPAVTTPQVRRCLERVLLVWATLHPDAGYVQGMNDILAPVLAVLLLDARAGSNPKDADPEADAHACLARLLGGVRDFYTAGRPGVRRAVRRLEALVRRVDGALDRHLRRHGVDYMLFAFRWMNNLLTRELPLRCSARLWDTLLAEAAPQDLTVYLCAAFLQHWRDRLLLEKDFNGVVLALQDLPTHKWGGPEVDALLAEAYRLQAAFADAPSHLAGATDAEQLD